MGKIFVFRNLYNIALSILSIPATQVSVERFSQYLNGFTTKGVPD